MGERKLSMQAALQKLVIKHNAAYYYIYSVFLVI